MEFSKLEIQAIREQLPDSYSEEPIRSAAIGFVDKMDGDLYEVKLKSPEEEVMTMYISKRFLEQRGLNAGTNKFCALVEYRCAYGQKLELVRLSRPKEAGD